MSESPNLILNYKNQLRPVLEMLKHKRHKLAQGDWAELVNRTEESIINSPEQYLAKYDKKVAMEVLIHTVFREFIEEYKK